MGGAVEHLNIVITASSFKLDISEDNGDMVVVLDFNVPQTIGIVWVGPRIERAGKVPRWLGQEASAGIICVWVGDIVSRSC